MMILIDKRKNEQSRRGTYLAIFAFIFTGVAFVTDANLQHQFINYGYQLRYGQTIEEKILSDFSETLIYESSPCSPYSTEISESYSLCWITSGHAHAMISRYRDIDSARAALVYEDCTVVLEQYGYKICVIKNDTFQGNNGHYSYQRRIHWRMGHHIFSIYDHHLSTIPSYHNDDNLTFHIENLLNSALQHPLLR